MSADKKLYKIEDTNLHNAIVCHLNDEEVILEIVRYATQHYDLNDGFSLYPLNSRKWILSWFDTNGTQNTVRLNVSARKSKG